MKRFLSVILVFTLLCGVMSAAACAVDTPYDNSLFYTQGD